ncbi:calmodulin-lysine N-methyltransferase [Malania oleifera]|uniref:calmodulin-lysine N-methyltransferase n=1 Tax=Malania oleifera TaxID=397392 RepID=UPI0025AEBA32|nr:calmodulin-lysine N-methyltransferase [Malania oleifera]
MEISSDPPAKAAASLRWAILRHVFLRRPSSSNLDDDQSQNCIKRISRKTTQGFNLIPSQLQHSAPLSKSNHSSGSRDASVCYTLPIPSSPKLFLTQRVDNCANLNDFEISNKYDIDNTGLVCHWPSEDVLAYFCLSHEGMFRSKRVIELGSGYGLAGLVIAAATEATEVVISDGNPQVVDYIQHNIEANSEAFGGTTVKPLILHWNQEEPSNISGSFDVVIASDCTFFEEFHKSLARTVKSLLTKAGPSEAVFFSPRRGNSLDKFLEEIKESGMHYSITENYETQVWRHHQRFVNGDDSWPNYEEDHCYPLLVRITH